MYHMQVNKNVPNSIKVVAYCHRTVPMYSARYCVFVHLQKKSKYRNSGFLEKVRQNLSQKIKGVYQGEGKQPSPLATWARQCKLCNAIERVREICPTPPPSPNLLASCEIAYSLSNHTICHRRKLLANPGTNFSRWQKNLPFQQL
jgi:hypothetical protein